MRDLTARMIRLSRGHAAVAVPAVPTGDVWAVLGRVQALLAGLAAGAAWTRPPRVPEGRYRIGGESRRLDRGRDLVLTASGQQVRNAARAVSS